MPLRDSAPGSSARRERAERRQRRRFLRRAHRAHRSHRESSRVQRTMLIEQSRVTVETRTGPLGIELVRPSQSARSASPRSTPMLPHFVAARLDVRRSPLAASALQRSQGTRTPAFPASSSGQRSTTCAYPLPIPKLATALTHGSISSASLGYPGHRPRPALCEPDRSPGLPRRGAERLPRVCRE